MNFNFSYLNIFSIKSRRAALAQRQKEEEKMKNKITAEEKKRQVRSRSSY